MNPMSNIQVNFTDDKQGLIVTVDAIIPGQITTQQTFVVSPESARALGRALVEAADKCSRLVLPGAVPH